jgi:hypothetical protein
MRTRATAILTLLTAITTWIWGILMFTEQATAVPASAIGDINLSFLHYVIYINAALITLFDVAMFTAFYFYCREDEPFWSLISLVFIPIYGLGNLISYLSQVLVVPGLLDLAQVAATRPTAEVLLGLTLHTWPGSAIGWLNGLSYAILGIPSIILGVIMYRKAKGLQVGSVLLIASGVMCMVGFVTAAFHIPVLENGVMYGGFVFMVSLVALAWFFMRRSKPEVVSTVSVPA